MEVVFATYDRRPDLTESDQLVADWLSSEGHKVSGIPWTETKDSFRSADGIVIRSTWDYTHRIEAFKNWLTDVEDLPVANNIELIRWNLDKTYLLELEQSGFRVPRTRALYDANDVAQTLKDWSKSDGVVKPRIGASGNGVQKVDTTSELETFEPYSLIIQEFLPEISKGELSLAFFGGAYSHTVIKKPVDGEFRINSAYGGKVSAFEPSKEIINQAAAILESLSHKPLYARVDGLISDQQFVLCELELIEPSFYLGVVPAAARRFGEAIVSQFL